MIGNERNFSLSLWDHKDNFICLIKSSNLDFEGQSYNETIIENINGEETLNFSLPLYIFNKETSEFEQNKIWNFIFNEQKIRYTEYDNISNKPKVIKEFVIKTFTESRNGYEKIIDCQCESLAVYELGKIGWNINFNTEYITDYDFSNSENLLTIDYWMEKILYWESNLGRVSNTTECTKLLHGLQLRDNKGNPIDSSYTTSDDGEKISFNIINEPVCNSEDEEIYKELYNPTGWYWEVNALYSNNLNEKSITTNLYKEPVIDRYIEITPDNYIGLSYQREVETNNEPRLLRHPIEPNDQGQYEYEYITDIKKSLFTVERSNVFSIIQELCETFGVWAKFIYLYNDIGQITDRKILFQTEAINEDIIFDFSYGKNLQTCSRNADSNELTTKLIITDVESQAVEGNILSIKQASANPTGEGYLYNFDYFLELGSLSKYNDYEKNGIATSVHSDEYEINYYYGQLKKYNEKILNLQKYLIPLYDRQSSLQSDLTVQEGSLNGYIDNIQSIQDKINNIPPEDQIIESWSKDYSQYNHVGELKTFSNTTNPENVADSGWLYLNFGREDVIYDSNISVTTYNVVISDIGNEINETGVTTVSNFKPRIFTYNNWRTGSLELEESTTTPYFEEFNNGENIGNTIGQVKLDYSELGDRNFIKGIYFTKGINTTITTYGRIRYKYAPLAYYYLLIKDYWDKIIQTKENLNIIQKDLQEIENKITINELKLNNILNDKKKLIYQFEKKYYPFIKEGYWEPDEYQSQIISKNLDTGNTSSIFEGLITTTTYLKDLNLNDSLSTYSYYIDLNEFSSNIDIESIEVIGKRNGNDIPLRRESNYEIYNSSEGKIIIGIAPDLITNYIKYNYSLDDYKSIVTYNDSNGIKSVTTTDWIKINSENVDKNPIVSERYIYLSNDNLITSSLKVFGYEPNIELEVFNDYNYSFDYAGYSKDAYDQDIRVDLNKQNSYSTNIQYDYITKITLKNTNNVNKIISNSDRFIVNYEEEITLDFLYNDAINTSKEYASPKVTYAISVVDLSSLNGYKKYKPILGQKVPIWDIEMNLKGYEGFITGIIYHLESPSDTEIEIATYKTRFEDIFQKLTATMTDIQYNQNSLYTAADSFNTDGSIKTEVFKKSLENNSLRVNLGVNNEISINENTGITLKDRNNNNTVKLIGSGIFLTEDNTANPIQWKTGITGEGINASAITSGNIDTKNISIWNASEEQIRFLWNDQGLFAFGDKFGTEEGLSTSVSTYKDLIDYNKYVKFNQNGLDFNDNGKSALRLGWSGLNINTQNNSLQLDADKGLLLQEWSGGTATTRLELGKLDEGSLYGLRLRGRNEEVTFQSDSEGDLWLHRHIRIGGNCNNNNVENATAGVYGLSENVPYNMQMGIRRNDQGIVIWDSTPIRFWAGPQSKNSYSTNIHIIQEEINSSKINGIGTANAGGNIFNNNINDNDPTLAKFKVSANGDIIASGIDVGGWVGQGDKLRSFNNEAIMRSNSYSTTAPVFAIGASTDIEYGSNYNFRVYQDGSLNIGNGQFTVSPEGAVIAKNITIEGGSSNTQINGGSIANLRIDNGGLEVSQTVGNITYLTGLYGVAGNTDLAFRVGPSTTPTFSVDGTGAVVASNIKLTSPSTVTSGNFIDVKNSSGTSVFKVTQQGAVTASNMTLTGNINNTNNLINSTGFSVTQDGAVTASNITITGGNGGWIISSDNFKVDSNGQIGAGSGNNKFDNTTTFPFSVDSSGNIRFRGTISAYSGSWYTGVDSTTISIQGASGYTNVRVIKGLIVGIRSA